MKFISLLLFIMLIACVDCFAQPFLWYKINGLDVNSTQLLDSASSYHANFMPSAATGPILTNSSGYAYSLDGNDDYLLTPSYVTNLSGSTCFAFSCWIYMPTSSASTTHGLFNISVGNAEKPAIYCTINNRKITTSSYNEAGVGSLITTATSISTGQWQHLVYLFDDAPGINVTNTHRHYINAVRYPHLVKAGGAQPIFTNLQAQLNLGLSTNSYFYGMIDDVRFYDNKSFYPDDSWVTNLYLAGRNPDAQPYSIMLLDLQRGFFVK